MNKIITSYYSTKTFINLFEQFKDLNRVVYNKSDQLLNLPNIQEIKIPNTGRETYTYLKHIIDNYADLPEYTIFTQDDCHNHVPNNQQFRSVYNDVVENNKHFVLYNSTFRAGHPHRKTRVLTNGCVGLHTLGSHDAVKLYADHLELKIPHRYVTNTCAFFICSKQSIIQNPLQFYEKALQLYLSDHIHPKHTKGYAFELMWQIIFGEQDK